MAIIIISRGSYSGGKDVAEKVAQMLGYRCIAREVILDSSKEFNIPETRLTRAVHDAPSILERFTQGKERYVAYFRAALLKQLLADNVVYHGLAGQFFVKGVTHVLKVRIVADMEYRVNIVMARDRVSRESALLTLKNDDLQRRKWGLELYGIDTTDPSLYDLVLHIGEITVEVAASLICQAAGRDQFRATSGSRKALELLAASYALGVAQGRPSIGARTWSSQ